MEQLLQLSGSPPLLGGRIAPPLLYHRSSCPSKPPVLCPDFSPAPSPSPLERALLPRPAIHRWPIPSLAVPDQWRQPTRIDDSGHPTVRGPRRRDRVWHRVLHWQSFAMGIAVLGPGVWTEKCTKGAKYAKAEAPPSCFSRRFAAFVVQTPSDTGKLVSGSVVPGAACWAAGPGLVRIPNRAPCKHPPGQRAGLRPCNRSMSAKPLTTLSSGILLALRAAS
jgi:hypothetical protein